MLHYPANLRQDNEGDPILETFMTTPMVKLANKNSTAS